MFKIITPVYNSEDWIGKCIDSVKSQGFEDFHQVIVDDASTDGTVDAAVKAIDSDPRFTVISRPCKSGTMMGHLIAMDYNFSLDDIIVHLDGDDWFSDSKVLGRLDGLYQDEELYATYGSYEATDNYPCICKTVEDRTIPFRQYLLSGWIFSQVRSFRSFLWMYLKPLDFLSITGEPFIIADVAVFAPILELAGFDRIKFVPEIQMVYNRDNPINDDKVNQNIVRNHTIELAQRAPKKCLK